MAHFKISLAGQLHFAPQAGDWGSLFVLGFCTGGPSRNLATPSHPTPAPTSFPTKDIVARSMANTQARRTLTLHLRGFFSPLRGNSDVMFNNQCEQQKACDLHLNA